jgi:putative NADPH-quinone reductase
MRLLAVLAHPYGRSLGAALLGAVREGADAAGHLLRVIDLYAEGFNPALPAEELRDYNDPDKVPDDLRSHVEALAWAEGIVFVHPTWWGGLPAMAKSWLDRAWRPGHAFHATNGVGLRPGLPRSGSSSRSPPRPPRGGSTRSPTRPGGAPCSGP